MSGRTWPGTAALLCLLAMGANAEDTLVVLNKEAASAWLIDPATGDARAKLPVGDGPHEGAASPDGRRVVVCNYGVRFQDGNTLSVIDVPAREVVKTIDLKAYRRPHGVSFFGDGTHVLVTSESRQSLIKVDVVAGTIRDAFETGGSSHMCVVSTNGTTAYATAFDGFLSIHDLRDSKRDAVRVDTGSGTEAIALHPEGEEVWVGNNDTHDIVVVSATRRAVVDRIECGLQPIRLAFTRDGRYALASCILSGDLAVVDVKRREVTRRVALSEYVLAEEDWKGKTEDEVRPLVRDVVEKGARPIGVLPGPDGRFAYVAARGLNHIAVIDLNSWKIVRRLPTGEGPDGMAFSRVTE